jgi:GMP synthase-like glutamine amidotransferase
LKALILQHVASEGPGTLGVFLEEVGAAMNVVHLYRGDPLPSDAGEADLVVSMGGPMNVYEDGQHPFLEGETRFLQRAMEAGVPVLGICLGAQLIARAAGGRVYRAPVGETGWGTVSLTEAGEGDPVTGVLPGTMPVLQWHEDTFDIPDGGVLLASSDACPHQAFRVGKAWGLQFHVEVQGGMLSEWFSDREERDSILQRYHELRGEFEESARRFYGALLRQAREDR